MMSTAFSQSVPTRDEPDGPVDARELARWLRREYGKVSDMTQLLRAKAAGLPPANLPAWLSDLRGEFERYRAHFIQQMALEERGGYLRPVTETHPQMAGQVEAIRHEHEQIIRIMGEIQGDLREISDTDRLRIGDACCRIQHLLQVVREHECQENQALSGVLLQDLGTLGH